MLNNSKPPHDAPLDYSELVRLHLEKFGVEPFITGINWDELDLIEQGFINDIWSNHSHLEKDLPPVVWA